MRFLRETDYHGSKSYEADEPPIGRARLIAASLAIAARRIFRDLLNALAPSSSSTVLLRNSERTFSLLGSDTSNRPDRSAEDSPFPLDTGIARDARDWRVLP